MTTDAPGTPDAETDITEALITQLLADQFHDLVHLPVRITAQGWDNVMVRIGDRLAARMPRHAVGARLLANEQKWLPEIAARVPLPVPAPLRVGEPSADYPFTWSIVNWLDGDLAATHPPDAGEAAAHAAFLKAVHLPAPEGAPSNSVRDCPLRDKQIDTEKRMANIAHRTDLLTPQLKAIWQRGLETEIDLPRTWIAGDVHPQNVLTRNGKLAAYIDWGDVCAGDAATDLASIWMLFGDAAARRDAISAYGMSEDTIARAMGWAVFFGVILLETGLKDDPLHAAVGEWTLRRLNADADLI